MVKLAEFADKLVTRDKFVPSDLPVCKFREYLSPNSEKNVKWRKIFLIFYGKKNFLCVRKCKHFNYFCKEKF